MEELEVEEEVVGMFTLDKTNAKHLFLFTYWRDFFLGKNSGIPFHKTSQ